MRRQTKQPAPATSRNTDPAPPEGRPGPLLRSGLSVRQTRQARIHTDQLNPLGLQLDATRLPLCGFTYCLLSLQSTFQLSLTVLVRYRTRACI